MFELHSRLAEDCMTVTDLPLCRLLLMNDANYPWFILVPRREGVREIFELSVDDQQQLLKESSTLAEALVALFEPDKINIAALGNMVPQLHIHHIARFSHDAAWPAPVWGRLPATPYAPEQAAEVSTRMRARLEANL